jgi:hypothetical protein
VVGYKFADIPSLEGLKVTVGLDPLGIHILVQGQSSGSEINHRERVTHISYEPWLTWSEWMIRGTYPQAKAKARECAKEYALNLLKEIERIDSGEAT